MNKLKKYQDIVIIDDKGAVIYFDPNNLKYFDLPPEALLGKKVTSLYKNFSEDSSTMMKAVCTGEPTIDFEQRLMTQKGNVINQTGSTYPILDGDKIIGAIEFSKCCYESNSVMLDDSSGVKTYNKNGTKYTVDDIITQDRNMIHIKEKVKKIALLDSIVLIWGKTGTGKELIAQAIHNCSKRANKQFVSLNCSAIPQNLLESILFGTTKGSFTGSENKEGLFEAAEGGTLFLDEVNSLSLDLQVKILKTVEERKIRRIGGSEEIMLNVQIIAATNESPQVLLREKRMREDLFYRLSVVQIDLPELKDRGDDIEILAQFYIDYYNEQYGSNIKPLSQEMRQILKKYPWPGNIRELKNTIESAFCNVENVEITLDDLPNRIVKAPKYKDCPRENSNELILDIRKFMGDYEKKIILESYNSCGRNISTTASKLKISPQLLRYRLKQYKEIEI